MAGWSNIFLQLVTPTGPVIGEGLLEGWQTSIEIDSFNWGVEYKVPTKESAGGLGGAIGGAVAGMLGLKGGSLKMNPLTIEKRFDIASAMIHTCLDNHIPILSASITVLNIKHGGRAIHQPGFTLVATDGYFTDVALDMKPSGMGVEVKETLTLEFKGIVISYLKRTGKDNVPTNPFFYKENE
jgi:hypothetical protein